MSDPIKCKKCGKDINDSPIYKGSLIYCSKECSRERERESKKLHYLFSSHSITA